MSVGFLQFRHFCLQCSVTEDSEYIEPSLYEFNSSGNRTFNVTAVSLGDRQIADSSCRIACGARER